MERAFWTWCFKSISTGRHFLTGGTVIGRIGPADQLCFVKQSHSPFQSGIPILVSNFFKGLWVQADYTFSNSFQCTATVSKTGWQVFRNRFFVIIWGTQAFCQPVHQTAHADVNLVQWIQRNWPSSSSQRDETVTASAKFSAMPKRADIPDNRT